MSVPLVSVVIPAYNAAKFITPTIESVFAQTVTDYEIIVVNDGSTDSTATVVSGFGDRVRLLSQANGGAAAARNNGIRSARGEWIAFLDSDDRWPTNHLEILLKHAAANPESKLLYGSKAVVDEQGRAMYFPDDVVRYPSGWIFGDLFQECAITCSTVIASTAALRALGGFNEHKRFRVAEDWDLYLRMAAQHPITAVPETQIVYTRRDDSLSRHLSAYLLGSLAALHTAERLITERRVAPENHPERIDIPARWRRAYHQTVVHLFTAGEYEAARQAGTEALRRGFGTIPVTSRALISFLPAPVVNQLRNLARRPLRGTAPPGGAP